MIALFFTYDMMHWVSGFAIFWEIGYGIPWPVYSILNRERLPRNWVDLGRSTYKMHRLLNIRNLLSQIKL